MAASLQEDPGIFTWPISAKTNELVSKIRCHSIVHAPPGVCIQEKPTHIHTYKPCSALRMLLTLYDMYVINNHIRETMYHSMITASPEVCTQTDTQTYTLAKIRRHSRRATSHDCANIKLQTEQHSLTAALFTVCMQQTLVYTHSQNLTTNKQSYLNEILISPVVLPKLLIIGLL